MQGFWLCSVWASRGCRKLSTETVCASGTVDLWAPQLFPSVANLSQWSTPSRHGNTKWLLKWSWKKYSLSRVLPWLLIQAVASGTLSLLYQAWLPDTPVSWKKCPISIIKPYLNPLSKSRASVYIAPCVGTFPAYRTKFKCHPKLQSTGVWGVIHVIHGSQATITG